MQPAVAPGVYRQEPVVAVCPNALLGFVGLMSLLLIARLGGMAALVFLLVALVFILRQPGRFLAEARLGLHLWVIAGWALVSVLWSAYPDLTLRHGLQMVLSFAFAIALANRVSPLMFLYISALSYSLVGLLGMLFGRVRGDGMGWLGLFNSKNAFAGASGFMLIACAAIALDRRFSRGVRLIAALGATTGLFLVIKGQSVGATLAIGVVLIAMMAFLLLHRFSAVVRALVIALLALGLALLLLAILSWAEDFALFVLNVTGKDVTLTGRTYLWDIALDEIAHQPWLGQGFQAVWVVGNPLAEQLWLDFGIETKIGFHFHNTYLSNAVELGIIGVVLQSSAFFAALIVLVYWAIIDPRAETLFLAAVMLRQLVLSVSEVVFFFQFDATTVLTIACIVYARRFLTETQRAPAAAAPIPPPPGRPA